MTILDVQNAIEVFESLPKLFQVSYLHPYYILADAARDKTLTPVFFVYQENGLCFYHAFHIQPIQGTNFIDIQSPYGYGGPVSTSENAPFLSKAWYEYNQWCASNNVLVEFLRFHPLLENWKYFSGDVLNNRETVWIDLTLADVMSKYTPRMRTSIRKGYRQGLQVEWLEPLQNISTFYSIYTGAMKALNASRFYFFSEKYFQELARTNLMWLGFCFKDSRPIAGAIFLLGKDIVEYHLGGSGYEGKKYGAMKMIFHEAALEAKPYGFSKLYLGGGSDTSPNNTLLMFKKKFSTQKAHFKIGRRIHNTTAYFALKAQWENKMGVQEHKILFYR